VITGELTAGLADIPASACSPLRIKSPHEKFRFLQILVFYPMKNLIWGNEKMLAI
jgi:hypothetical protein